MEATELLEEIVDKWCPDAFQQDLFNQKILRALFEMNAYIIQVDLINKGEEPLRKCFPQDLPSQLG
jgi:hypothetical protein